MLYILYALSTLHDMRGLALTAVGLAVGIQLLLCRFAPHQKNRPVMLLGIWTVVSLLAGMVGDLWGIVFLSYGGIGLLCLFGCGITRWLVSIGEKRNASDPCAE